MQDLNDMVFFAEVAERGGFAVAARALGVPKSRLSRRVAELEDRVRAIARDPGFSEGQQHLAFGAELET